MSRKKAKGFFWALFAKASALGGRKKCLRVDKVFDTNICRGKGEREREREKLPTHQMEVTKR